MRTLRSSIALAFVTALVIAVGAPARADSPFTGGTWTLLLENDRLADTDRHYSHGTRLAWVSDRQVGGPDWVRRTLDFLYPFAEVRAGRIGFALGQNIYTPEDISRSDLIRDDRPYAGWLYVGGSVHAETKQTLAGRPFDVLDTVEIDLGMVGSASLAEPTQKFVHELIDTTRPRGWRHQLDNEPGLVIIGERKWRPLPVTLGGFEADMIPHLGGAVGNVFTHLNAGSTFRIGQNLWLDYGPPHIQPALSGLEAVDSKGAIGWYLFVGVEGRAVGRNIFLDGNTFSDSHSVDKRSFVGDFQLGAAIVYRGARLAFTHVYRTREFDGQREPDSFAAVSLSVKF